MKNLIAILEANKARNDTTKIPEVDDNKSGKKENIPADGKTLTGQQHNEIDVTPLIRPLKEAATKKVVLTFGRMNPPTVGHQKLVDKVEHLAMEIGAIPMVFLSRSEDPKKNPIPYDQKLAYAKKAFGSVVKQTPEKSADAINLVKSLNGKFDDVVFVVGSDRVPEFEKKLTRYNGNLYHFNSIHVVSAGERDPDAEGVEGMSASKMRKAAKEGDFSSFKKGLPHNLQSSAKEIYQDVRLEEDVLIGEELTEALTAQQRQKRAIQFRRIKNRVELGRKRALRRRAPKNALVKRSRRLAIKFMRNRILRGQKYSDLPYATRAMVDARLKKRKKSVGRIAQRLLPKVVRAEATRRLGSRFQGIPVTGAQRSVSEENIFQVVNSMLAMMNEDHEYALQESETKNLREKAIEAELPFEIIESVFRRGLSSWQLDENTSLSFQEYAFNRVNSFLSGGAAFELDFDLLENLSDVSGTSDGKKNDQRDGFIDNAKDDLAQTVVARDNSNPVPHRTDARPGNIKKIQIIKKIINEDALAGTKRRIDMPQLTDFDAFKKDLEDSGHKMTDEIRKPADLNPMQKHFNQEKVDRLIAGNLHNSKPIIVSKDDQIIDGHHRCVACEQKGTDVKTRKVSMTGEELMNFVKDKPYVEKKRLDEEQSPNLLNR